MRRPPTNNIGTTAFHSIITTHPRTAAAPKNNTSIPKRQIPYFIATPSGFQIVVHGLQTGPQMQDRTTLARQQGVERNSARLRHLFEAAAFELMLDEYVPLLGRQLVESPLQCFQDYRSRVERFGSLVESGQLKVKPILPVGLIRSALKVGRSAFVPAKAVNDAIARDTEQPSACLLKGFGKPIGLDELFKHIL